MRKIIVSPGGMEAELRQQMTTENLIWIKGGAYKDIKKALRQWIDLYANESLAFLGYCLLVKRNLGFYKPDLADLGASYPLSLLITQKPARLIFKKLLNREPVVYKPPPTFWDGVYTIILFFGFAILSLVVIDKFK